MKRHNLRLFLFAAACLVLAGFVTVIDVTGLWLVAEGPEPIPPTVTVVEGPEPIPPALLLIAEGPEPIPPAVTVVEGPEPIPPTLLIAEGPEPIPPLATVSDLARLTLLSAIV